MKYCFGIDIGGTSIKMGLFDTEGNLQDKWEIPTRKENGKEAVLTDIATSVKDKIAEKKIDNAAVCGVGMGVPGPVEPDGYVSFCVNLGWRDCNPGRELSEMLGGLPVRAANDANVAALGEFWRGGAQGCSNVVLLTLGTGVGGGVIINGKVVDGVHGAGGELGHVVVNPDETLKCNCGNYGCLEQYASATGVVRVAGRILQAKPEVQSTLRAIENYSAKDVFDAAKAGDAIASEAVDTLCKYLGFATANCAMTIDPEVFVIGGGVSRAGAILTDGIGKYFDKYTPLLKSKAKIALATLGNDAGIYGAARLIL
ncbi:MAG: ROK family glucokinase [Lachnospiraceae bacterium]|nr:ROK family glucokinase [Lachnospiraceae bacterium]